MHKRILITGATDGIGLLTAEKLYNEGHEIILHGRNEKKLNKISKMLGNSVTYQADFSSLDEVILMSNNVLKKFTKLDVLINNAGILKTSLTETISKRDVRFDVNMIAPYILTKKLLPIIPKFGRVINLSSAAQSFVNINALKTFQIMDDMEAYSQSKLGLIIWSNYLSNKMQDGPIFVTINPGSLLATKMVKEGFGINGNNINIGADILVKASISKDFIPQTGMYFDNDKGVFSTPHQAAKNLEHIKDVMNILNEISSKLID